MKPLVWVHRDGKVCRRKRRGHGAGLWYSRSYARPFALRHQPRVRGRVIGVRCFSDHEHPTRERALSAAREGARAAVAHLRARLTR